MDGLTFVGCDPGCALQTLQPEADIYLPTTYSQRVMELMVKETEAVLDRGTEPVGLRLLPDLLTTAVPNLEDLGLKDILAIRHEECFEAWRTMLSNALTRMTLLDPEGIAPGSERLKQLGLQLDFASAEIKRRVQKSRVLGRLPRTAVHVGVPTAAGAVGLVLAHSNPVTAIAVDTRILVTAVVKWLLGRPSPGDRVLLRHAMVFHTGH